MSTQEHSQDNGDNPHRIGQMNGPYAVLFKLALLSFPPSLVAAIGFSVWVTSNIYDFKSWKSVGPRFTSQDAQILKSSIHDIERAERDKAVTLLRGEINTQLVGIANKQDAMSSVQTAMTLTLTDIRYEVRGIGNKQADQDHELKELKPKVITK